MKIKELRIILTVDNLDEIIQFYRDVAGMETSKEWHEATGNGIILDAGRASLEQIHTSTATLVKGGAISLAVPTKAPWSDVARIEAPGGMQITLFTESTLA